MFKIVENLKKCYIKMVMGDNLYEIANANGLDLDLLLQINGLNKDDYIYPNQTLFLPNKGYKFYLTKDNETLKSLADNLGATISEIIDSNEKIYLQPEQIIVIKE